MLMLEKCQASHRLQNLNGERQRRESCRTWKPLRAAALCEPASPPSMHAEHLRSLLAQWW